MNNVEQVTKKLEGMVASASRDEDEEVNASELLATYANALASSSDPIVRESFAEACLDVLKPRGEDDDSNLDNGRLAVLKDSALSLIPLFLPLAGEGVGAAREVLQLIAKHADAREVILALNEQIGGISERADPYAVSSSEDEDEEESEIDWERVFPQLEEVLDMYTAVIPRLKTQRSTPTLLSLQDCLVPLLKAIPATAPASMAVHMSRSLIHRVCHLVDDAWIWSQEKGDAKGEQNAICTELLQVAVMIFGPNVCADLTPRWFLSMYPKYADLHPEEEDWAEAQAVLETALTTNKQLGIDRDGLIERITTTSSVRPQQSIASLILLAASLPPLHGQKEDIMPGRDALADAMPLINICINGSAVDAGTALTWALIHAAQNGHVQVEHDQATFLLELVMPVIQIDASPNTRLALSKLLGAIISVVQSPGDRIRLYEQLLEPLNPFQGIRVHAISLLREELATRPEPLLIPALTEMLEPLFYRFPPVEGPLDLPLPKLMESIWPSWCTEAANFIWFMLDIDKENKSGFGTPTRLTGLKNLWLSPLAKRVEELLDSSEVKAHPEVELQLDRLSDALGRAKAAIEKAA